ncbi:hypothetical protein F4801DRAFT_563642 [Xylaria longipes]|nr:hypothetical protein F4801DRAFT_563642 [Xylaria longipes]
MYTAWRQFSELKRLISIHQGALTSRRGTEEFEKFLVDLETLVGKPLRYGCSTLHGLQVGFLEFRDTDINHDDEHRVILSNMLREAEISIINNTLGTSITNLLPSWARQAPELRSDNCPGQDCFRMGDTALDIAMLQIPIELINGVRRVQSDTLIGGMYSTNRGESRAFETVIPWSRVTVARTRNSALFPKLKYPIGQWITGLLVVGGMVSYGIAARERRPLRRKTILMLGVTSFVLGVVIGLMD